MLFFISVIVISLVAAVFVIFKTCLQYSRVQPIGTYKALAIRAVVCTNEIISQRKPKANDFGTMGAGQLCITCRNNFKTFVI